MIRFYPLFVTDNELLASPYIKNFNLFNGITLQRGHLETVNFLIQTHLTSKQCDNLNIIYDQLNLHLDKVQIKPYKHQTVVSVSIIAKEIGSMKIGLEIPEEKPTRGFHLSKVPLPLAKVPYSRLKNLPAK